LRQQDFFTHDWDTELHDAPGSLLIPGNLPWVTNQIVASLNGSNVPVKENFPGYRGIAARTGKSNFDISEWMFLEDTCYYLPFAEEAEARVVADILNSPACREFLDALMFPDSKRPITVEFLQRLHLSALAGRTKKKSGGSDRF
jgi:protein-disulfide isomerase